MGNRSSSASGNGGGSGDGAATTPESSAAPAPAVPIVAATAAASSSVAPTPAETPSRPAYCTDLSVINAASYELAAKIQAGRVERGHSAEALQGGSKSETGVYTSGRIGWH